MEPQKDPIAVWQHQSQYNAPSMPEEPWVLLPNSDGSQPREQRASDLEVVFDSDQHSTFTPHSSSDSTSFSTCLPRPGVKIPTTTFFQGTADSSVTSSVLVTQAGETPRNESFYAAQLKFMKAKLARHGIHQEIGRTIGSDHRFDKMYVSSGPLEARRTGAQTTPHAPRQSSSSSYRNSNRSTRFTPSTISRIGALGGRADSQKTATVSGKDRPIFETNGRKFDYSRGFNGLSQSRPEGWRDWVELGIKLFDLPVTTTIHDLYDRFSREGTIAYIEIYEDTKGLPDGKACVRFSPPPATQFWSNGWTELSVPGHGTRSVQIQRENKRRDFSHPSPVNKSTRYPELMVLCAESLDFGIMHDPVTMMTMCRVLPTRDIAIEFRQDMLHRELKVAFQILIQDPRQSRSNTKATGLGLHNRVEKLQFRIPFSQLKEFRQVETENEKVVLLISLENPPAFFKQVKPLDSHENAAKFWSDNDSWYRLTDVAYDPNYLKSKPLSLKKLRPLIDLGRWTTYRFVFDMSKNRMPKFDLMRQALRDYNINVIPFPGLKLTEQRLPSVWIIIDKPLFANRQTRHDLDELTHDAGLTFEVRYQLEVCISHGLLNEYSLNQEFVTGLARLKDNNARDILEYVANHGERISDPMTLFSLKVKGGSTSRAKIPHYCVYIRSATVTPTALYIHTPLAETSNRVLRKYADQADRFLRVRFLDERSAGKIYANEKETMNEVFTRFKRVMTNGIVLGDRKYEYLACGNSQFREHGAYFFAPSPSHSTDRIRRWMGSFEEIETVPLYVSRIGQCFSTTRAIHGAAATLVEIPDVERNGHKFTDGVGRISSFLAALAASELGIFRHSREPPSVYQIRVGGCKGILAVCPASGPQEIHIRKTQYKFPALHEGLEIIRWSQFACANLNRQLILILSALGVPDHVFHHKLQLQLAGLERAMTEENIALSILQKDIDHNQMTLSLAGMILDGFQTTGEPFMLSLLQLWRAWSIKYLKEKARITIGSGAHLLGCVDETATLRGHFNDVPRPIDDAPVKEKAETVPQVFVQLSNSPNGKPEVILGPMLIARNPSLHPGDVRVVCGVDVPKLHHLKDVVVLPQTGDRDVAGMCSGGDLDGDDFLVIWDQDLLPYEWNHEPMDYTPPQKMKHGKNIGIGDLTTFFITYMKNDNLSRIANAHLANADYLDEGIKHEKCLRLAALHSLAVDFIKTGQPAQMTKDLRPPKRPHFMDNTYIPIEKTYTSRKILGQLYDQVERIDFVPSFAAPFDERILNAYDIDEKILDQARQVKSEYDAHMRRIMAQHEIKTEFEVWSTFVLEHDRTINDFKFHEQIGQLSNALKDHFKAICWQKSGGKDFHCMGPFVAAMYKVTSIEVDNAVKECGQYREIGGRQKPIRKMVPDKMPLMSFPWLFPDVLGQIAKNSEGPANKVLAVDLDAASFDALISNKPKRNSVDHNLMDANDDLQTIAGVTRRGDVLELFDAPTKLEKLHQPDSNDVKQSTILLTPLSSPESQGDKARHSEFNNKPDPVDLMDLAPTENSNSNINVWSASSSDHSSDLASLNHHVHTKKQEFGEDSDLTLLRRSFSDASSDQDSVFTSKESASSGQSLQEVATVLAETNTGLDQVRNRGDTGDEQGEGDRFRSISLEDNESDHEEAVSLETKVNLLDRLTALCEIENSNPAAHDAEAKVIESPIPFLD